MMQCGVCLCAYGILIGGGPSSPEADQHDAISTRVTLRGKYTLAVL